MLHDTGIRIKSQFTNFVPLQNKNVLNSPTGRFFYDPWIILDEYKGTVIEDMLSSFPSDIGEARIIVLSPGTAYYAHADIDDRYHLNISSEQSYLIDLENNNMHPVINDNSVWEMDAGRIHSAVNFGSYDRLQLVVRKLLKENKINDKISIVLSCDNPPVDYRYKFDNYVSTYLNRAVKNGKINNFENYKNKISFEFDSNYLSELKEALKNSKIDFIMDIKS
jgi:hypothetical protein